MQYTAHIAQFLCFVQYIAHIFFATYFMTQSSTVLQHVGTNIRSLRDERGLSQQDLAHQAGVSRRTIAALETGQVNISLAKLDAIAVVLGVDFRTIVSAPELKEQALVNVNVLAWQGNKEESKATLLASVPSRSQVELWTWSLAVGESYIAEADAEVRHLSFYYRYERWILPLLVMVPAILIIAYVPYFFKMFGWYS